MTRKKVLNAQQRESGLLELIGYAEANKFNPEVIQKYKTQLLDVQEELKREKEKRLNFKRVEKGVKKHE